MMISHLYVKTDLLLILNFHLILKVNLYLTLPIKKKTKMEKSYAL